LYCPLANFNIACFSFSGSTVLPPTAQLFQKVSRSIDIASVKDFANSIDAFLAWQSFLFGNQLSYFKDHVYLKSNYWNEIREMSFLKKKKVFLKFTYLFKGQHTSFNTCSSLIILYFENRNWPVERLKWLFPWFFVLILISDLGYIFW
jgi:hypothetical protein